MTYFYKKVSVEKEGNPKESGWYECTLERKGDGKKSHRLDYVQYHKDDNWWSVNDKMERVIEWSEEVEAPPISIPSEELPSKNDLTEILWAIKMGNMQIDDAVTKIRNQAYPVISSLKKSNQEKEQLILDLRKHCDILINSNKDKEGYGPSFVSGVYAVLTFLNIRNTK